jgi:CheY-like chemotaxis protein
MKIGLYGCERINLTRILEVDDDKDTLYLLQLILEDLGFIVHTYTDPVKALSEFEPQYYSLAILDYRMLALNGLELYERIREVDGTVSVILLTASHEQLPVSENNKEGMFRTVRKPVSATKLIEEVTFILSLNSHLQRA